MPTLEIVVPADLGGAQECLVVTWLKRAGDPVQAGDALVILQAEKVSFDVVAPVGGTLESLRAEQGEVVAAGQVLATVEVAALPPPAEPRPPVVATSPPGASAREIVASPAARRLAREQGVDLGLVRGSGEGGRITEKDVMVVVEAAKTTAARPEGREVRISPIAKRLAQEQNVDLMTIQGTGEGGRITEKDVRAVIVARSKALTPPVAPAPAAPAIAPHTAPMAGMRQAIARRMTESLQSMAQLTLHTEADVTDLVVYRSRLKNEAQVSYTDLIVKACALALQEHPAINVTLQGDTIVYQPDVHIGLATALDTGLVVPVIQHANTKSLTQLAQERQRLVERARAGQLAAGEMRGSTFTVTNLGGYDIDWFTPIINPPEAAILGVGRIVEKIVLYQGRVAQRAMMGLSLTIDHRLIDGAPGAAFLKAVKQRLEAPEQIV